MNKPEYETAWDKVIKPRSWKRDEYIEKDVFNSMDNKLNILAKKKNS